MEGGVRAEQVGGRDRGSPPKQWPKSASPRPSRPRRLGRLMASVLDIVGAAAGEDERATGPADVFEVLGAGGGQPERSERFGRRSGLLLAYARSCKRARGLARAPSVAAHTTERIDWVNEDLAVRPPAAQFDDACLLERVAPRGHRNAAPNAALHFCLRGLQPIHKWPVTHGRMDYGPMAHGPWPQGPIISPSFP